MKAESYWEGREARFEGSGGTSGETTHYIQGGTGMVPGHNGGSGGGIIWLTTPDTLVVKDSTISADGRWGRMHNKYEEKGSGGGSGGSIQV